MSRVIAVALAVAASGIALAADVKVTLTGGQEVPPVKTEATGTGTISIGDDKAVSGSITTKGIKGSAAHIHEAPAGKNGGVIVPLAKGSTDGTWDVPQGAKLSDAQLASFKAGNLYVNVHSAAHPDGEIRGQLKP
ncbi:MAG TPA: CHRD domain-containing protein [Casimicrobiaceae bacterium]|nr:CHRD domain-containing protein [Casimicrobiaceae bacterium]